MKNKNQGIELLRIISMTYVIILHTLSQGGILFNSKTGSYNSYAAYALEVFAFCAVNIFGLISGYVKYNDSKIYSFKISSYLKLWLQVVFYNVVVAAILILTKSVPNEGIWSMFFPITTNAYWYFTAFSGVMALAPLVDAGVRAMSNRQAMILMFILFMFFSIYGTITPIFNLAEGYSVFWLLICYIIGGIVKKCNVGKYIKSRYVIYFAIFSFVFTLLYIKYGFDIEFSRLSVNKTSFVNYTSPTIFSIAIAYLVIFSKLRIKEKYTKYINLISGNVFAAYLINTNYYSYHHVMLDAFKFTLKLSAPFMILIVIAFSFAFVILSAFIDKLRVKLFEFCRINNLLYKIDDKISQMV